jgi:metal-responsive CopG/Arc/MetJ family transcriptional regulator
MTKLVEFNCPESLLKEFDEAYKKLHFKDRTEALLALMRQLLKEAS